jgi:hypothetical protein
MEASRHLETVKKFSEFWTDLAKPELEDYPHLAVILEILQPYRN